MPPLHNMFLLFPLPKGVICDKIYVMKKLFYLLLITIIILCACDTRDEVFGTYKTDDGNKGVEFAYSKVFYTLDKKAAELAKEGEETEALIEGWYSVEGDNVICTFNLTEDGNTQKHVYTFLLQGDVLTLRSYTLDGTEMPIEREEYKK